jgi:hypothetical protein
MKEYVDSHSGGRPHSVLGVSSFVVALLATLPGFPWAILTIVLIAMSVRNNNDTPAWLMDSIVYSGLCVMGSICLIPISLLLGLLSLFERDRRHIYGLVSVAQSLMLLCPFVTLGLLVVAVWGKY